MPSNRPNPNVDRTGKCKAYPACSCATYVFSSTKGYFDICDCGHSQGVHSRVELHDAAKPATIEDVTNTKEGNDE